MMSNKDIAKIITMMALFLLVAACLWLFAGSNQHIEGFAAGIALAVIITSTMLFVYEAIYRRRIAKSRREYLRQRAKK